MHFWRSVNRIGRRTPGSFERVFRRETVISTTTAISTGNCYELVVIGR
jgi:hypothetical protein